MCQAAVISRQLGRIGRKSFDRRMRMASPLYVEKQGELNRLLNDVDKSAFRVALNALLEVKRGVIVFQECIVFTFRFSVLPHKIESQSQDPLMCVWWNE